MDHAPGQDVGVIVPINVHQLRKGFECVVLGIADVCTRLDYRRTKRAGPFYFGDGGSAGHDDCDWDS
jgi:hypothetical protein